MATQKSQTQQLLEESQRIQGENERLGKEQDEVRSQSVQQLTHMLVQGSTVRDEVRRVLFREDNTKPKGYASVQTSETHKNQPITSVEIQRPSSSEQHDLIEVLW